jgi:hypothetical protein
MFGEAKNQFSFTRGALSTFECQKTNFLSVTASASISTDALRQAEADFNAAAPRPVPVPSPRPKLTLAKPRPFAVVFKDPLLRAELADVLKGVKLTEQERQGLAYHDVQRLENTRHIHVMESFRAKHNLAPLN